MYVPSARRCCSWLRLASPFLHVPHSKVCLASPVGTTELNPEDKIITLLMKVEEIRGPTQWRDSKSVAERLSLFRRAVAIKLEYVFWFLVLSENMNSFFLKKIVQDDLGALPHQLQIFQVSWVRQMWKKIWNLTKGPTVTQVGDTRSLCCLIHSDHFPSMAFLQSAFVPGPCPYEDWYDLEP